MLWIKHPEYPNQTKVWKSVRQPKNMVTKVLERLAESPTTYHAGLHFNIWEGYTYVELTVGNHPGVVELEATPSGTVLKLSLDYREQEWIYDHPDSEETEAYIIASITEIIEALLG